MSFYTTPDDVDIYYELRGDGFPIVFIHGFMGMVETWKRQVDHFSKSYKAIAYDFRGAGRSDKPLPRIGYSIKQHADDLHNLLSFLGVRQAVVVGHSMGGMIAFQFCLDHPEMVKTLVSVASLSSAEHIGGTSAELKNRVKTKKGRYEQAMMVGAPEPIPTESWKLPLYAILGQAEGFLEYDARERLKEITAPTLVVAGADDLGTPADPASVFIARSISGAEYHVLKGNHFFFAEDPEAFNELLRGFLESRGVAPRN